MTDPVSATPVAERVGGYVAMWDQTDADRRQEAIAATWTEDASEPGPRTHQRHHPRHPRPPQRRSPGPARWRLLARVRRIHSWRW